MFLPSLWLLASSSSLLVCALPTLGSVNSENSVNSKTIGVTNRASDTAGLVGRIPST